jgi:hypothetical protein
MLTTKEDTIIELEDVQGKIQDCLDTLRNGKELDSTQEAFMNMHNI